MSKITVDEVMYSVYDCLVETSNILHMSGVGTLGAIFECLNDEDN